MKVSQLKYTNVSFIKLCVWAKKVAVFGLAGSLPKTLWAERFSNF